MWKEQTCFTPPAVCARSIHLALLRSLGKEGVALSCSRGGSGWILGKMHSQKEGWTLTLSAQGGGGVTVPESIQEEGRCATKGHG